MGKDVDFYLEGEAENIVERVRLKYEFKKYTQAINYIIIEYGEFVKFSDLKNRLEGLLHDLIIAQHEVKKK